MLRLVLLNFFIQATVAVLAPYVQIMFRNKGYSHSLVGVAIAVGQIASIIVPILMCMISDRTRRTKALVIMLMVASVVFLYPTALSSSLALTFVFYFLTASCFWSLNPMMDGYETRLLRGNSSAYGLARSAGTMGYVVALILFGLTGFPDETDNHSIWLCFLITAAVFLLFMLRSPKDLPVEQTADKQEQKSFSFKWFSSKYWLMMLIVALSRFSHAVPDKLLASYMTEVLGLGDKFTLLIALGALSEFVMMLVGGRLLQTGRAKPYLFVLLASAGLAVRLMIYYFAQSLAVFTLAQLFHSVTFGALHIGMAKFIAQDVKKEHYSLAMSLYWAIATNLPAMLGALFGGFIIDYLGYRSLFAIYTIFPVAATVLCLAVRRKMAD
ncbi:MAG: MFS transporter [Spirochaetales bacterium]|nr:MFS transporter [Spirochaetales bacterium]